MCTPFVSIKPTACLRCKCAYMLTQTCLHAAAPCQQRVLATLPVPSKHQQTSAPQAGKGAYTVPPASTMPMETGVVGGVVSGTLTTFSAGAGWGAVRVTTAPLTTFVTAAGLGEAGSGSDTRAAASLARAASSVTTAGMGAEGGGGGGVGGGGLGGGLKMPGAFGGGGGGGERPAPCRVLA